MEGLGLRAEDGDVVRQLQDRRIYHDVRNKPADVRLSQQQVLVKRLGTLPPGVEVVEEPENLRKPGEWRLHHRLL